MNPFLWVMALTSSTTTVTASDFSDLLDALTAQLNVSSMVSVLSLVVASAVGLAFAWWGIRKVVKIIMAAFKRGRVSV